MSNLEISAAVFPTLTAEIFASEPSLPYSAPHEEWTISLHPSSDRRLGGIGQITK
jgi:hypothetical protein